METIENRQCFGSELVMTVQSSVGFWVVLRCRNLAYIGSNSYRVIKKR